MYTLECFDASSSSRGWREIPAVYHTAEAALDQAARYFADEDHAYTLIRLKRSETVCTLIRPGGEAP